MDKNKKELVFITTPDCTRCRFIRSPLETRCEKNWYKFKEMEYSEWLPWMEDITAVPCAMIGEDVILDYDWIMELITSVEWKKSFY